MDGSSYNVIVKYDSELESHVIQYHSIRELRRALTIMLEQTPDEKRCRVPMSADVAIRIHDAGRKKSKDA